MAITLLILERFHHRS